MIIILISINITIVDLKENSLMKKGEKKNQRKVLVSIRIERTRGWK
jgi:hypothetical protein